MPPTNSSKDDGYYTGRYGVCPVTPFCNHLPQASPISRTKKGRYCYVCGTCNTRVFINDRDWTDTDGYTFEECLKYGFNILKRVEVPSRVRRAPKPPQAPSA